MRVRRGAVFPVVLVAAASVTGGGCTSTSASEVRASEVYGAAVRWLATERADDPEPLPVFVEPRGEGTAIKLEVQVEVVNGVTDDADVRFIDARGEAITEDEGVEEVRDGGVLVRLGPVVEDGERIRLEVDRWVSGEQFTTYELTLRRQGDSWILASPPVETGTIDLEE